MKIALMKRKYLIIQSFLLLPLSFFSQKYPIHTIDKNLLQGASAIIRNDEVSVVINDQKKITNTRKRVVTVLDKSADGFSNLYFGYDPYDKIKSIKTTVYDKEGNKIKTIKKSEYLDVSPTDGFSLYTDNRALLYKYHPLTYPYTIEYEIERETSYTVFIADYMPLFTREAAIENSSYTISNLSESGLRKKMYSTDLFKINEEKTEKGWKYSVKNVPSLPTEVLSPSLKELVPRVSFALSKFYLAGNTGEFSDWNSFGKWVYSDLLQSTQEIPVKARSEIRALVQGIQDDKEKIRILYQHMQDKTRYINVSIGIGGWKPMKFSEVYSKGYGDCKALTNYMYSILKEIGLNPYYTIINASESEENFDLDFPRMGGNHVVLCIPMKNDTIWLENTSQSMAFNELGISTANRNAIAISQDQTFIVRSKKYNSDTNTENVNFAIELNKNGDAVLKGDMVYKGLQYSNHLYLEGQDSRKLQNSYKENFSHLSISDFTLCKVTNNRNEGVFQTELNFKTLKYATVLGNNLFFNAVPVGRLKSDIPITTKRELPFEIPFGYTDTYVFAFNLPKGCVLSELPPDTEKKSDFGSYKLEFKKEGSVLIVTRKLQIKKGKYSKERFNEYVNFRNLIFKLDNQKINITTDI